MDGQGVFEIVACGLRPEASLGHLAVLLGFVGATAWLAPARRRPAAARPAGEPSRAQSMPS